MKCTKRLSLVIIMLIGVAGFAQSKTDTLLLTNGKKDTLSHYYHYFQDCGGMTAPGIDSAYREGKFKSQKKAGAFTMGFSKCAYWLQVTIKNSTAERQEFLWSFNNNGLNFVLYERDIEKGFTVIDSNSMHRPILERNYPARTVSFTIYLNPAETKTLFVKVSPTVNDNIYFPSSILTSGEFIVSEFNYSFMIGKYIGFFTLAFIVNSLLWIALKNKIHLFHALYVLFIACFTLNDSGLDALTFGGWMFIHWSYISKIFFAGMGLYFFARVFQIFTNQRTATPVLYKVLMHYNRGQLILSLALLIVSQLFSNRAGFHIMLRYVCFYYTLAGYILILISLFTGVFKKKYYFLLFLISSFLLLMGFVALILNVFKINIHYNLPPGNIINGLAAEIAILTVFFVYKYRKEKEAFQREAIEHQQKINENIQMKENLASSLLQVQERERKRIAEDLHDDVGSTLSGIKLLLQNNFSQQPAETQAEQIYRETILSHLKKASGDLRDITHNLMPKEIESGGFSASVLSHLHFLAHAHPAIAIEVPKIDSLETLPHEIQLNLYRITYQLLQNVIDHAGATKITFQCLLTDQMVQIMIEDNGRGFVPNEQKSGIGLLNLQSRVAYLQGTFLVDSSNLGTTITIEIPIK